MDKADRKALEQMLDICEVATTEAPKGAFTVKHAEQVAFPLPPPPGSNKGQLALKGFLFFFFSAFLFPALEHPP
eukprot:scaffold7753_cov62-Isochrysis_galbana.AAC.1